MDILYGTGNPAKLSHMRSCLHGLDLKIIGLCDLPQKPPAVEETGDTPLENARFKAEAYYAAFHMPVFSCDSGLYFKELPPELQPGVHVRRVNGKRLNDEEMIRYYGGLARWYGGLTGWYQNAVCLIVNGQLRYESMDNSLAVPPFRLTGVPHPRREPGFPLDCLSVDIPTGRYFYDLPAPPYDASCEKGFAAFFQNVRWE